MKDYAYKEKRNWLYSFKRRQMLVEATQMLLVGIGLGLIIGAGL